MKKMKSTAFTTLKNSSKSEKSNTSALFVKLGVCAAACALVLLVRVADKGDKAVSNSAQTAEGVTASLIDEDEQLGKLQFVELPGIIEVFAKGDKQKLPIEARSVFVAEDECELLAESDTEQYISVFGRCSVKIAEDGKVVLTYEDDFEVSYAGNIDVSVEEGQTLKQGDTLGSIAAGEILTLKTAVSGRPVVPTEVFALK